MSGDGLPVFSGHEVEHELGDELKALAVDWPLAVMPVPGAAPLDLVCVECGRKIREHPVGLTLAEAARYWDATRSVVIGHLVTHHQYNADGSVAR